MIFNINENISSDENVKELLEAFKLKSSKEEISILDEINEVENVIKEEKELRKKCVDSVNEVAAHSHKILILNKYIAELQGLAMDKALDMIGDKSLTKKVRDREMSVDNEAFNTDLIPKAKAIEFVFNTIKEFYDIKEDDIDTPISDKDKLLIEINKTICSKINNFKENKQ